MKLLTYLQQHHSIARRVVTDLIKNREILRNGEVVASYLDECATGDQYIITSLGISGIVDIKHNQKSTMILFHKPVGYTVSKSDPHNETIYEILPFGWKQKYYPIGRLDKDSCGLLLLTDNSNWVNQLSHPRYEHRKLYHVLLTQKRDSHYTQIVLQGVMVYDDKTHTDVLLACDDIYPIDGGVAITLHEGKNRHIRKMLGQLGYDITQLKRISCCGIGLQDLQVGEYVMYEVKSLDSFIQYMSKRQ